MVHPANSWCLQSIHTAMRLYKMDLPLRRNNLEPGNVHVGVFDQSTAGRGRFGSVTRTQTRSAFANLSQQMLVMQLWSNRQRWIDTIWGAGGASSSQAGQLIGSARLSRMNMTGTTGFKALASENAFFLLLFCRRWVSTIKLILHDFTVKFGVTTSFFCPGTARASLTHDTTYDMTLWLLHCIR